MTAITRNTWTLEDKERGLATLVISGDSPRRAAKMLEEAGVTIDESVLRCWRRQMPDRYAELREQLVPKLEQQIAAEAEALALEIASKERDVIEALTPELIAKMDGKDLATALKNMTTSKALQVDKIQGPLRGRPNAIIEYASPRDTIRALARDLGLTLDVDAEDITDAQEINT